MQHESETGHPYPYERAFRPSKPRTLLPESPTDKANQAKVREILKEVMGSAPTYSNRHKTCRTYKYLYGRHEKAINILNATFLSQNLPAHAEPGHSVYPGGSTGLKVRVNHTT